MGVNQSSATTATDTGAGTAVAPVSGAEATAELNAVTIRRLGGRLCPAHHRWAGAVALRFTARGRARASAGQ